MTTTSEATRRLLAAHPLIDGHNDLPWVLRLARAADDLGRYDLKRLHPETDTDIPRLLQGGVAAQVLAAYLPTKIANPATVTLEQIDLILRIEMEYRDVFFPVRGPDDIPAKPIPGRIGSIISVEGTVGLEGSLAPLRIWHRLGVRLVTLCHNETLPWVDSATDRPSGEHSGLSAFGQRMIEEMNRLGLIVDLAHVAPHAMHKVIDASRAPVVISHSNAAALCPHRRNTPDDVLAHLSDKNGLIMVTFVPEFLNPAAWEAVQQFKDPYGKNKGGLSPADYRAAREACLAGWHRSGIDFLCQHLEHITAIVGEDRVGIGSDFYGGPNPPGLEDASKFPDVIEALLVRGWSETAVAKLMGGNFLRVWREILAVAG
jgi:membrane dipeptidase